VLSVYLHCKSRLKVCGISENSEVVERLLKKFTITRQNAQVIQNILFGKQLFCYFFMVYFKCAMQVLGNSFQKKVSLLFGFGHAVEVWLSF